MILISIHQRSQKITCCVSITIMVQAQPGKSTDHSTGTDAAVHPVPVSCFNSRLSEFSKSPLWCTGNHLGNHGLDSVFGGEIQLPIIVGPVKYAGRNLDRPPQKPVPKKSRTILGSRPIIPLPIFSWRIRFAKNKQRRMEISAALDDSYL
jgi:hypothetical protein